MTAHRDDQDPGPVPHGLFGPGIFGTGIDLSALEPSTAIRLGQWTGERLREAYERGYQLGRAERDESFRLEREEAAADGRITAAYVEESEAELATLRAELATLRSAHAAARAPAAILTLHGQPDSEAT